MSLVRRCLPVIVFASAMSPQWMHCQSSAVRDAAIDHSLQQCLDDPLHGSTGAQDDCMDDATKLWDALLNERYQALLKQVSPQQQTLLRSAQRAWIASRNADVALIQAVYNTTHGTMYAPMNANDVMMLTTERAKLLGVYLERKPFPWPAPITADKNAVSNSVRLPHAAADAHRRDCSTAKQTCSAQLLPLYTNDLHATEHVLQTELHGNAAKVSAAESAWKNFQQAETQWIEALYAQPLDRQAAELALVVDRVERLQGLTRMVGMR